MIKKKFEQKEKNFSLFKNQWKKSFKQPDLTGKLIFGEDTYNLAAWVKDNIVSVSATTGYVKGESAGTTVEFKLKINDRKSKDTHPDRVGEVTFHDVTYSVGAYKKNSEKVGDYLTGSVRDLYVRDETEEESEQHNKENSSTSDGNFDFDF